MAASDDDEEVAQDQICCDKVFIIDHMFALD
jgi:hypothetical protein